MIAVAVLFLLVCVAVIYYRKNIPVVLRVLFTLGLAVLTFYGGILAGLMVAFSGGSDILAYSAMVLAVLAALAIDFAVWGIIKKKFIWIPLVCLVGICIITDIGDTVYRQVFRSYPKEVATVPNDFDIYEYAPFAEPSKVARLDGEAALSLEGELPVMDGAAALYPVYSAFFRALYPEDEHLPYSNTRGAYQSIVDGERDIIFVVAPSEEQLQYAADNGVELEFTPIGKEAFVFFVNAENPIDSITVDQIKGIYSGKITNWSELGANGLGKIRAFQRNEGSGSQTALINLMGSTPLMNPPKEDVSGFMGGIITQVADYRNFANSIGFSFRFYATEMVQNNQIKLLSIDGVYPSEENVRNGSYPLTTEFYAVTRSDADENTRLLLDWICGEQGQELIEKTGYTPIK